MFFILNIHAMPRCVESRVKGDFPVYQYDHFIYCAQRALYFDARFYSRVTLKKSVPEKQTKHIIIFSCTSCITNMGVKTKYASGVIGGSPHLLVKCKHFFGTFANYPLNPSVTPLIADKSYYDYIVNILCKQSYLS